MGRQFMSPSLSYLFFLSLQLRDIGFGATRNTRKVADKSLPYFYAWNLIRESTSNF